MLPSTDNSGFEIIAYLKILKKRAWLIAVFIVIFSLSAVLNSLLSRYLYRATAELIVERHPAQNTFKGIGFDFVEINPDAYVLKEKMETSEFAEAVAKRLKDHDPGKLLSMIEIDVKKERGVKNKDLNIMDVSAVSGDPADAAKVVNAWIKELIAMDIETRQRFAKQLYGWISDNRQELIRRISLAEDELAKFKNDHEGLAEQQDSLERLKERKYDLEERLQNLSLKYKDKHPEIVHIRAQLETIEDELEGIRTTKDFSPADVAKYDQLSEQLETNKKLYEKISETASEMEVSRNILLSSIQVIEWAEAPSSPIHTTGAQFFQIIFIGLVLGVCASFLVEYFDKSFTSGDELEAYLKATFLGAVPTIERKRIRARNRIVQIDKESEMAEIFRNIKVNSVFSYEGTETLKTIGVTSSTVHEGATLVASNLAITFAHGGQKTLLVDADIRKGALWRDFCGNNDKGLSDYFMDNVSLNESLCATAIENLYVIPSGTHINNPLDYLSLEKFELLLASVSQGFDKIIFDIPAINRYGDPSIFQKLCNGMILVVEAEGTQLDEVQKALKKMKDIPVLGVVLNFTGTAGVENFIKKKISGFEKKIDTKMQEIRAKSRNRQ